MDEQLVSGYLQETMTGCAKEPTFGRRRNLVTYAVDLLMGSKSNDSYLSGIQILGTTLELPVWYFRRPGQPDLIQQLLTESASCGHMIQRLIQTMGTESSDSRVIREHAAMIVAHVADAIHLRYFPGGTQFLSFLLNTVQDYRGPSGGHYDQGSRRQYSLDIKHSRGRLQKRLLMRHGTLDLISECTECDSNWLVVQGLSIVQNLIADEDNCRIKIQMDGLLSKITAPLISDLLRRDHHDEWSEIAEELLKLMSRLMATPGESGKKLRGQIDYEIVRTLERIVSCPKCGVLLVRRATQILLDLFKDPASIRDKSGSSCIKFTWILLHIFLVPDDCFDKIRGSKHWEKKSRDISTLAGEMLSVRDVDELTEALAYAGNISSRVHAAEILEHLCCHHTTGDEYLKELKKAIVVVMPKVLREILPSEWTRKIHSLASGNNVQSSVQDSSDLEMGDVSHGNAQDNISSSNRCIDDSPKSQERLQVALVSLCKSVWFKWYDEDDSDVTHQLDEVAANVYGGPGKKSFTRLVREAEDRIGKARALEAKPAQL